MKTARLNLMMISLLLAGPGIALGALAPSSAPHREVRSLQVEESPSEEESQSPENNSPPSKEKGGPSKKKPQPSKPEDDPYQDGRRSAEQELGRLIARKVWKDMQKEDQQQVLDRYRETLRGELLKKRYLERESSSSSLRGYVMATRDGHHATGAPCREMEMDLIYNLQRNFQRDVFCWLAPGEWQPTPSHEVQWGRIVKKPVEDDWLPPLPKEGPWDQ